MKRYLPLMFCLVTVCGLVFLACQPADHSTRKNGSAWFGGETAGSESKPLEDNADAQTIVRHFETQKLDALKGYLQENPRAKDRGETLDQMANAARAIDDPEMLMQSLELRLADYPTGPELNVREYMLTASSLLNAIRASNDKERFEKAHARIADAIIGNDDEPRLTQLVQRMGVDLNRPWKGEPLEFNALDIEGNYVDSTQWKGKVVLLNFWTTWDESCLAEMPNLRKTFEQYHNKGFEIVSVSLDTQRTALHSYIAKSPMAWPQVCDGKGWDASLAQKFQIHSIPASFLIGKDGKVIATDLRGEALPKAVAAALAASALP